jgi:ParB family transcriptional regulator, chromosome partitioning protein
MFSSRSTSNKAAQATPGDPAQDAVQVLRELPLDSVAPNPSQPRRNFDEEALRELAHSIGECGVLQPLLVRPCRDGKYELIAGERRWRAARIAGLQAISALVRACEDAEALETALIENMARQDLNPVEQARACVMLAQEFGLSHRQIAGRVGRHKSVVANLTRLLKLSAEMLELLERGKLTAGHGVALLMTDDLQQRAALAGRAIEQGWSVRVLERHVRASKASAPAPEDAGEQAQAAAQNVARVWGDLLGAEVHVRSLPRGQLRMEVTFVSAAEGIALADRLAAAIARGSKGR